MNPSKLLPNKGKNSSLSKSKNFSSTHQQLGHSVELFSDSNHYKKGLSVTNKSNIYSTQQHIESKPQLVLQLKERSRITPNNKIYNAKVVAKPSEMLNKSTFITIFKVQQQQGIESQTNQKMAQMRPQSSNPEKYPYKFEVQRLSKEKIIPQLRPGSSKSSRLFKKKVALVQDRLHSQKDELDDIFITVNNRSTQNQKIASLRERQRIGTSISKKMRGMDKFQTKLDPQFFNLFAS